MIEATPDPEGNKTVIRPVGIIEFIIIGDESHVHIPLLHSVSRNEYELPGGAAKHCEIDSLPREIFEETGLEFSPPGRLTP